MSEVTKGVRSAVDHALDALEMTSFNEGFEACLEGLDVLSNVKHNNGETIAAEHLLWAIRELKGENIV